MDWCATDERKEISDGALLTAGGSSDGGAEDSPMQTADGQRQIWTLAHRGPPTRLMLIHAPVSCACCCAGTPRATLGAAPRVDSDGQPACEGCGRRLSKCKGKLHKQEPGKICQQCYDGTRRSTSVVPGLQPLVRSHKRKQPPAGQPSADFSASITLQLHSFTLGG